MSRDGAFEMVGARGANSSEIAELIEASLIDGVERGRFKATALVQEIFYTPADGLKVDAVSVKIRHQSDHYTVRFIYPFTRDLDGSLKLGTAVSQPVVNDIFVNKIVGRQLADWKFDTADIARLAHEAYIRPDIIAGNLGLNVDSAGSSEEAIALVNILCQVYNLRANTGLSGELDTPSISALRQYRLLNHLGQRPPNATRQAILSRLSQLVSLGARPEISMHTNKIAIVAAKLGDAELAERAFSHSGYRDTGFECGLLWLASATDALRTLVLPATGREIGAMLMLAELEVRRGNLSAAREVINKLPLRVYEDANSINAVVDFHLSTGDNSAALAVAREVAAHICLDTATDFYLVAIVCISLWRAGDVGAGVTLCRSAFDCLVANGPNARYPGHYYLAFAAYWLGCFDIFEAIKSQVPTNLKDTKPVDQRVIFWSWFISMATELSQATPTEAEVVSAMGDSFYAPLISRALVLGQRDTALATLERAIEKRASLVHPKELAACAVLLERPNLAVMVLNQAEEEGARRTADQKGSHYRGYVAECRRLLELGELVLNTRVP